MPDDGSREAAPRRTPARCGRRARCTARRPRCRRAPSGAPRPVAVVHVAPPSSSSRDERRRCAVPPRASRSSLPACSTGQPAQARAASGARRRRPSGAASTRWRSRSARGRRRPGVEDLRRERAHVRVEPPRLLEEQALARARCRPSHVGGGAVREQVRRARSARRPADGCPGAAGRAAADRRAGRAPAAGEPATTLARRIWPASSTTSTSTGPAASPRATRATPCRRRRRWCRPQRGPDVGVGLEAPWRLSHVGGSSSFGLLADPTTGRPAFRGPRPRPRRAALPMTLWLLAVTPTRLPRRPRARRSSARRCRSCRCPADPGSAGCRRRARRTIRVAAASGRLVRPPQRCGRCLAGVGRPAEEQRAAAACPRTAHRPGRPRPARARRPSARSAGGSRRSSLVGTISFGTSDAGGRRRPGPAAAERRPSAAARRSRATVPADAPGRRIVDRAVLRRSGGPGAGTERVLERALDRARASTSCRPPIGSRSSTSSSSVMPHELEEAPPEGLVLAAVPVEELGEQPARGVLGSIVSAGPGRPGRPRSARRRAPRPPLRRSVELLGAGAVVERRARERAPRVPRGPRRRSSSQSRRRQLRQDVVAVVAAIRAEDRLAHLAVLASVAAVRATPRTRRCSSRRLLRSTSRIEAVQRLEALDRVALDAGPDALADDAVQVDEDAAPRAAGRPRPRGSRGAGRAAPSAVCSYAA